MARSTNSGGSGPSKKRSLVRSARNKVTHKYEKQRRRTEANKLAKAAKHAAANPHDHQGKGS